MLDLDPARVAELAARVFPRGVPKPSDNRGFYVGQRDRRHRRRRHAPARTDGPAGGCRPPGPARRRRDPDSAAAHADWRARRPDRTSRNPACSGLPRPWPGSARHFAQPVTVDEMAASVHMSASSFHERFKAVTSMSPLQYQKVLRLHEARRLMLFQDMDASDACRRVGYLSASQFSRECRASSGAPRPRTSRGCARRASPPATGWNRAERQAITLALSVSGPAQAPVHA